MSGRQGGMIIRRLSAIPYQDRFAHDRLEPALWPGEPIPHELSLMIARIVEKDMDEHEYRVERLDRELLLARRPAAGGPLVSRWTSRRREDRAFP
jgi:hypothetical protein